VCYTTAVWFSDQTPGRLRNLVNTAHYRPLRIANKDFEAKLSKNELSNIRQRATPAEWVKYTVASRKKPLKGNFFDNSRGKIGKQKLSNRLRFMAQLTTDWIDTEFTKDRQWTTLKMTFFNSKKMT